MEQTHNFSYDISTQLKKMPQAPIRALNKQLRNLNRADFPTMKSSIFFSYVISISIYFRSNSIYRFRNVVAQFQTELQIEKDLRSDRVQEDSILDIHTLHREILILYRKSCDLCCSCALSLLTIFRSEKKVQRGDVKEECRFQEFELLAGNSFYRYG